MRFLYKKAFPRKLLSRWLRHSDSEASCLVINCECRRRLKHLPHLLERCWWRWPAHLRCNNHCCSNHNYNDVTQQLCRSRATAKLLCSTTQRIPNNNFTGKAQLQRNNGVPTQLHSRGDEWGQLFEAVAHYAIDVLQLSRNANNGSHPDPPVNTDQPQNLTCERYRLKVAQWRQEVSSPTGPLMRCKGLQTFSGRFWCKINCYLK